MKALRVKQPFASLIATGAKPIETRSWNTTYRGKLLICSSRTIHTGKLLLYSEKHFSPFSAMGIVHSYPNAFPLGIALAIADLIDCRPMEMQDQRLACCEWYEGAYSWCFGEVIQIEPDNQKVIKGALGIFNVPWEPNDFL